MFKQFYKEYIPLFKKEYQGSVQVTLPHSFYEPILYTLMNHGKQIRPAVLSAVYTALSGKDVNKSLPAAISVEMVHNFTLLHDDIMDGDVIRHGHATVNAKWDDNTAILAGDGLFAIALKQLDGYKEDTALYVKLMPELLEAVITVSEGQAQDLEFESRNDVSLEEYLEMIDKKTAKLLSVSAKLGAYIAGVDNNTCYLVEQIINELGIVFQIQDDLLELTASELSMGKSLGSDLIKKKKTYPFLYAKENLDSEDWHRFLLMIDEEYICEHGTRPAIGILEGNLIFDRIQEHIKLRHVIIQGLISKLPKASQTMFESIVEFIMNRKY